MRQHIVIVYINAVWPTINEPGRRRSYVKLKTLVFEYPFILNNNVYRTVAIKYYPTMPRNITCIRTPTQRARLARTGVGGGPIR